MKNFILGIFFGIVILVAAVWYYDTHHRHVETMKDNLQNAVANAGQAVKEKLDSAHLSPEDIKDELTRTGRVVREKAESAGAAVTDAATDARITSTIKGKLVADPGPSSLSISVSTTDGVVTLSGSASSLANIQTAIKTAINTDGVHKVISTIQVK